MMGPPNQHESLRASYSFDTIDGHDESGNGHDFTPAPEAGPARWGVGQSAAFNGSTLSVTAWPEVPEGNEMTVSFWIFLRGDSVGSWRTILRKGDAVQQTPTIQLWSKERRLHARVTTETGEAEGVDSTAVIPLRRWTHVSFVVQGKLLQLYVNGVFDAQVVTRRQTTFNRLPLYLGKDPWHPGTACFVDNLRIWSRALDEDEVRAHAAGALGPVGPTEVALGCLACSLDDAMGSCSSGYHLCSEKELFGGAYSVARAQGWFHLANKAWALEHSMRRRAQGWTARGGDNDDAAVGNKGADGDREDRRLGLCCTANNGF